MADRHRNTIPHTCEQCANQFQPTNNSRGRYCSRTCYDTARKAEIVTPRPCAFCSKLFTPKLGNLQRGQGRFCSLSCHSKAPRVPLLIRFNRLLSPPNDNGCRLWLGSTVTGGYGMICVGGRGNNDLAHRVAWTLVNGPIPDALDVLHKCDTPACAAIEHLFLGTQTDNNADMCRKDRFHRKISNAQAVEIRTRFAQDGISHETIAREYHVHEATIRRIVQGITHKYA